MTKRMLAGLAVVLVLFGAATTLAQTQRIGLYSDTEGSNCSLTDTAPGFFQVFPVCHPLMIGGKIYSLKSNPLPVII